MEHQVSVYLVIRQLEGQRRMTPVSQMNEEARMRFHRECDDARTRIHQEAPDTWEAGQLHIRLDRIIPVWSERQQRYV